MPDSEMLDDMEFETKLLEMGDDQLELTKFTVRQVYATRKDVASNTGRIVRLEKKSRKFFVITGGLGSIIGGAVITVINYFTGKT